MLSLQLPIYLYLKNGININLFTLLIILCPVKLKIIFNKKLHLINVSNYFQKNNNYNKVINGFVHYVNNLVKQLKKCKYIKYHKY
jgi:hypothetical protein